jgi:hypothetical protein
MPEPLFGTVQPMWSAVPFPTLAWFQTPVAATRAIGGNPPGILPSQAQVPLGNGLVPGIVPPGPGVTAPALVTAMAMRRGQPAGPTSDQEIEEFIYDALEFLPGSGEVEVRCDGGRTSLAGAVSQKRLKRDIGEIAWAIPAINDVQNNITIAPRRRTRAQNRDPESTAVPARKPA